MKRTNRLILVVGILLAVVAFVGVFFLLNQKGSSQGQGAIAQANVVVATRDIKLGEAIQENQVEQKQIPISDKKPEYIAQTGDVIGQVARTDVAKGAYLTVGMFSGAGQTSLSKDLPAGMRAVAIRVDAVSGVGTLILPGDRVDIAITVPIQETGVNGSRTTPDLLPELRDDPAFKQDSSKLILQNIEIRSVIGASVAVASTGTTGADPLSTQQIVILGVTPQQAEVIQYLQQVALTPGSALPSNNITLILRSPKDRDAQDAETTGIVLENLIKDYGVLPPYFLEASFPPK